MGGNWLFIYDTDIIFNYEESIKPLWNQVMIKWFNVFNIFSLRWL